MKRIYLTAVLTAIAVLGCTEEAPNQPEIQLDSGPTIFDLVVANCVIVQAAAESSFADLGRYAYNIRYLTPYLPDGQLLTNPVTEETTEPVFFEPNGIGSTSYRAIYAGTDHGTTYQVGYAVVGMGELRDTTLTNASDSLLQLDYLVIENCKIAQSAVEAFADDNGGAYPTDNSDRVNGLSVTDYLPNGELLVNPYEERYVSQPNWSGPAGAAGETGYLPSDPNSDGRNDGYVIDGMGGGGNVIHVRRSKNNTVYDNAALVWDAVEDWYDEARAYPPTLLSQTPSGKTVIDLLPDGELLLNPFFGTMSEPSDGVATAPGDVGYVSNSPDSYSITGYGEHWMVITYEPRRSR